jgi:chemotaxis protein MotA
MNISSLVGVLVGLGVVAASLTETGMDLKFFLNFHGIVIVCGGTFAAAAISYPLGKIFMLTKVFFNRLLGKSRIDYQATIEQLLEINKKLSLGLVSGSDAANMATHPFLKEAVILVSDGVLNEKEIRAVLEQRLKTIEYQYQHEAHMFKALGKYPPAFGLLATTLGMIALLQKIGQPGAEKLLGPAMSIGLVGTLYGIGLANLFFIPVSDALIDKTEEEMALRRMMVEGAVLLKQRVNPLFMRENLNSFLMPKDRIRRKSAA